MASGVGVSMGNSHTQCGQCLEWIRTVRTDGWVPIEDLRSAEAEIERLRALLVRVENDSANWLELELRRDIRFALEPDATQGDHR